jgi:hypothetical protein
LVAGTKVQTQQLTNLGMVSHGTRLYLPLAWYALQSLNLLLSSFFYRGGLGSLAAGYPIHRYFFHPLDSGHMVRAGLHRLQFVGKCARFGLFQAMLGVLGSKGFPEQFDDLCCTQLSQDCLPERCFVKSATCQTDNT